ncbi:hypothetical protein Egran_01128 [Elaphomyces granulatus]|uniref:Uncharacterized protein n=1 Tax=Elaphomyces granulatus TaxID=519963 RepID=A0A232M422_9EURO|nr:hypothetical protein Egran_01128 [Elaphomyces granulatus]
MDSSSSTKPQSKPSSQRLPPPSLFQGPPSRNASNISLAPALLPSAHSAAAAVAPDAAKPPPLLRSGLPSPFLSRNHNQGEADRAEALWQEMQNSLAEVELSAVSGEHVFGEEHQKALEDLRMKQLKLAQAWARSEVDEVVETKGADEHHPSAGKTGRPDSGGMGERGATEPATAAAAAFRTLEEETENDLQVARERRDANDRYFNRVNGGVLDVVAKLEEVAQAMRAVERESRDIWSDSTSEQANIPAPSLNG